jgi:hypothetical protein
MSMVPPDDDVTYRELHALFFSVNLHTRFSCWSVRFSQVRSDKTKAGLQGATPTESTYWQHSPLCDELRSSERSDVVALTPDIVLVDPICICNKSPHEFRGLSYTDCTSCDHRVISGAVAIILLIIFLQTIKCSWFSKNILKFWTLWMVMNVLYCWFTSLQLHDDQPHWVS